MREVCRFTKMCWRASLQIQPAWRIYRVIMVAVCCIQSDGAARRVPQLEFLKNKKIASGSVGGSGTGIWNFIQTVGRLKKAGGRAAGLTREQIVRKSNVAPQKYRCGVDVSVGLLNQVWSEWKGCRTDPRYAGCPPPLEHSRSALGGPPVAS